MCKIRYVVAMILDDYIAGGKGEADWIDIDPEVDFAAIWAQFDTLLMGTRTYSPTLVFLMLPGRVHCQAAADSGCSVFYQALESSM